MSDLSLQVRLSAEAGQLVGQLRASETELQKLTGAEKAAASAATELKATTTAAGAAATQTAAAVGQLAAAEKTVAASATGAAAAQAQLAAATRSNVVSAGALRAAQLNVSRQISDIQVQAIAGTNAFLIFGQQASQLADAMSNFGGKVGTVGSFLAGPYGAAVIGAITVGGLFATSLLTGGEAADKKKEALAKLKQAEDELNDASKRVTATSYNEAQGHLAAARAAAEREIKTRNLIRAQLEAAREELRAQQIRATAPGQRGDIAALGLPIRDSRAEALERRLAEQTTAVAAAEARSRRLEIPLAQLRAAEATDKNVAAQRRYERAIEDVTAKRQRNLITEAQASALVLQATNRRDAETEALRRSGGAANALTQAQADLAAATTGVERATAQLALTRARARADGKVTAAEAAEIARQKQALDDLKQGTRDAAKETRELESALKGLEQRFDGVEAANRRYTETLREIVKLRAAGQITAEQETRFRTEAGIQNAREVGEALDKSLKERLGESGKVLTEGLNKPLIEAGDMFKDKMADAGRAGADAFRQRGIDAAQAIAQVIGGRTGDKIAELLGLLTGAQTGNFNSAGGRLGGLLTLVSAGSAPAARSRATRPTPGSFEELALKAAENTERVFGNGGSFFENLQIGLKDGLRPLQRSINDLLNGVGQTLGLGPEFAQSLGKVIGPAILAVSLNQSIAKALGNDQIKDGMLLSLLTGPFIARAIGSSLRGSATLGMTEEGLGVTSTRGNSKSRRERASSAIDSVAAQIEAIAEQFGATIGGTPTVSIGVRKKKFRVDTTGQGRTKGAGVVDFGKDEEAARAFAIGEAIRDGVLLGLTPAVTRALSSSSDVQKAVREALKVDEIETLLAGVDGAIGKTFRDLERQIAERNRIAAKYGFDLVKLEEQNARDRQEAFERVISERVGALQGLLKDLDFGNLFEGTLVEQREKLLGEIAKAEADATAGKDGAAQQVAELRRRLLEISREAFGTAGGEFAADLTSSRSSAERIIALENERAKAQADAAKATNDKLDTSNGLANEANNLLAEQNALLRRIASAPAASAAAVFGGSGRLFETSRVAEL